MIIEPYLDIDPSPAYLDIKDPDELTEEKKKIRCKYYVAEGSCRCMIEMKGVVVQEGLHAALAKASDISGIFTGNVGASSPEMLNCLIAVFLLKGPLETLGLKKAISISRYAANQLAIKTEVSELRHLMSRRGLRHSDLEGFFSRCCSSRMAGTRLVSNIQLRTTISLHAGKHKRPALINFGRAGHACSPCTSFKETMTD
eukprot:768448-Hanusia_phi.AAC.2